MELSGGVQVKAGSTVQAVLDARDPEGVPLTVDWVLMADAERHSTGGYHQDTPPSFPDHIIEGTTSGVTFRAPGEPGLYRIFAYVGDGQNAADVANIVFRVDP